MAARSEVTQAQISHNDMEIERLKNEIHHLEEQVGKTSEADGKLTIYRQQAALFDGLIEVRGCLGSLSPPHRRHCARRRTRRWSWWRSRPRPT